MKILFITPQYPFPTDNGGKIGALSGIKILSQFAEVDVLSFTENIHDREHKLTNVNFIEPIVHRIHFRDSLVKSLFLVLKSFIKHNSFLIEKFKSRSMTKLIRKQLENNKYDWIFIDYLNMYHYMKLILKHFPEYKDLIIIKNHNSEYDNVLQLARSSKFVKKWFLLNQSKITEKLEKKFVSHAKHSFFVSNSDLNHFKKFNTNAYLMPPIYDSYPDKQDFSRKNKVLFVANLSWLPNYEGLLWFLDNCWTKIYTKLPGVTLTIIGSSKILSNELIEKYEGISYLGYVEDLTEQYSKHDVFIVPLFKGSGIRVKIIEAINYCIPVVSTNIGAASMNMPENSIKISDTGINFADDIIDLIEDEELRINQTKLVKLFFRQNFTLTDNANKVREILSSVKK